ncbi:probable glucosamine 6-phosphate N-acetyltransferase [Microplitis mediator]|uniref:probable glucosamine 6-phosphate N-acetyltransferase n=1 Tax=Microplitis mediator TaxID=375433 RepID=UPI00255711A7|nr:probable glucosamine 6-phosphate N-acetyltransferase [Microplitis mediator]
MNTSSNNDLMRDDELDLFNASLLDRLANQRKENGLLVRPLRSTDYDKGFIQLLGQLTDVGNITKDQFLNRFFKMKSAGGHYVVVVEDLDLGKVIGSATLVVEQKFIHNCALKGRLEDVVVNSTYRGKQLGKLLVSTISQLSRSLQCYKLSLDCRDRLIKFYESLGFKREPGNANSLNMRFETTAEQSRL